MAFEWTRCLVSVQGAGIFRPARRSPAYAECVAALPAARRHGPGPDVGEAARRQFQRDAQALRQHDDLGLG